jgi:hypothetical protein
MKITNRFLLFYSAVFLLCGNAHATIKVGDFATTQTVDVGDNNKFINFVIKEVMAVDTASDSVEIKRTVIKNGTTSGGTEKAKLSSLTALEEKANTCTNGKKTVVQVPAGKFATCHEEVKLNGAIMSTDISSQVPFSIVQADVRWGPYLQTKTVLVSQGSKNPAPSPSPSPGTSPSPSPGSSPGESPSPSPSSSPGESPSPSPSSSPGESPSPSPSSSPGTSPSPSV